MSLHGNVVFSGDDYSAERHEMAVKKRGLKNWSTTADTRPYLKDPEINALFESRSVLSFVELESRYEIYIPRYIPSIEVDEKLTIDMGKTSIYPLPLITQPNSRLQLQP